MVNACKTQTVPTISSENTNMETIENSNSGCPEVGTCSVVLHKNKSLAVKEDGTGAMYPEIIDGQNIVVAYTYSKEGPAGTADGNYSETIHFEIPTATTTLNKSNTALNDVKLLYGKHCFCKGEAGYYEITDGNLQVSKNASSISFDLKFNVGKTSQVVSHIKETVKL